MGITSKIIKKAIGADPIAKKVIGAVQQKNKNQELLQLQNYLFPTAGNTLVKSPKQIINALTSHMNEKQKTIDAALNKANNTDNPKDYFASIEKLKKAMNEIEELKSISSMVTFENNIFDVLPGNIDQMIERCWEDCRLKVAKETTENAKRKQYQVFFDVMDIYKDRMFPQNIEHINYLKTTVGL